MKRDAPTCWHRETLGSISGLSRGSSSAPGRGPEPVHDQPHVYPATVTQPDGRSVGALLDRVTSVASLLYTIQMSLDSLTLGIDATMHNRERAAHAKDSLDAALIQMRALGVAIAA